VKLFGGQKAISGNIIVKQKGNKFWPAEGVVTFTQKKKTRFDGRKFKDTYISVV
jgi:large subunit ribosomal protein L27